MREEIQKVGKSENQKFGNSDFLTSLFLYASNGRRYRGNFSTGKFLAKDFLTLLSNNSLYNGKKGVGHIFIMARQIIDEMIISQSI